MSRFYLLIDAILLGFITVNFLTGDGVSMGTALFFVMVMYLNGLLTGRSKSSRP